MMKRETIDIGRLLEQTLGEMDEELCASGFQLKDYHLDWYACLTHM